jgi:hypothetical protein
MRRACCWLLLASGCVGTVGERAPGDAPGNAPGKGGGGNDVGLPGNGGPGGCQEAAPAVTAIRRLTQDQYLNTVRELLGDPKLSAGSQLPRDDLGDDVFADPRTLIVSPDWASSAMDAAEAAARSATANLSAIMPCDPAVAGETACAQRFITAFGKRAFRRPLESGEVTALTNVYGVGARSGGFSHGIELVVRALLQSPSFLYRVELGQKDGSSGNAIRLSPHEVASRLSYLLWNTMPDPKLLGAADGGKLATADDIAAQARRMLADPRARATLADFHGRWMGIADLGAVPRDPTRYPQFGDPLTAAMRTELGLYVEDVMFAGDGRLDTLLTSHFTYVDATLAPIYGVPPPAGGTFARVDLDPAQRSGVLTSAGVITAHTYADESEAIHRGKFVRERLLCTTPPDPPPDLMVMPPAPAPGVPVRQRLAEHSVVPSCKACHVLMDPIGFGFEAYDALGRYRTKDTNGAPIDDSGVLAMTADVDGPFKGPIELGQKLARSNQVRDCAVSTTLKYAEGPDAAGDACTTRKLTAAFDASRHDLRELFVAITRTDGFRYRRAIAGEAQP